MKCTFSRDLRKDLLYKLLDNPGTSRCNDVIEFGTVFTLRLLENVPLSKNMLSVFPRYCCPYEDACTIVRQSEYFRADYSSLLKNHENYVYYANKRRSFRSVSYMHDYPLEPHPREALYPTYNTYIGSAIGHLTPFARGESRIIDRLLLRLFNNKLAYLNVSYHLVRRPWSGERDGADLHFDVKDCRYPTLCLESVESNTRYKEIARWCCPYSFGFDTFLGFNPFTDNVSEYYSKISSNPSLHFPNENSGFYKRMYGPTIKLVTYKDSKVLNRVDNVWSLLPGEIPYSKPGNHVIHDPVPTSILDLKLMLDNLVDLSLIIVNRLARILNVHYDHGDKSYGFPLYAYFTHSKLSGALAESNKAHVLAERKLYHKRVWQWHYVPNTLIFNKGIYMNGHSYVDERVRLYSKYPNFFTTTIRNSTGLAICRQILDGVTEKPTRGLSMMIYRSGHGDGFRNSNPKLFALKEYGHLYHPDGKPYMFLDHYNAYEMLLYQRYIYHYSHSCLSYLSLEKRIFTDGNNYYNPQKEEFLKHRPQFINDCNFKKKTSLRPRAKTKRKKNK